MERGDRRRRQGGSWPSLVLSLGNLRSKAIEEQTSSVLSQSTSRGARLAQQFVVINDTGTLGCWTSGQ